MKNLINSPVLAEVGDYFHLAWYQWLAIALLIVLIVVYMKIRNKQT